MLGNISKAQFSLTILKTQFMLALLKAQTSKSPKLSILGKILHHKYFT